MPCTAVCAGAPRVAHCAVSVVVMRSTQGKAQRRAGACSCRRGSARGQWPGSRPYLWLRGCKGSASCARECRGGVRGALARGRAEERRGVQAAVSSGAGNQYRVQGAPSRMQRQCRWVPWPTFRAAGQAAAQRYGQGRAAQGAAVGALRRNGVVAGAPHAHALDCWPRAAPNL